ncbi:MAG: tyrosine-type recombinase/integrase, partial [Betaproteobacteria bacterium]|nr:tyrosine-type recombinase/integrase [Betaproteobacteria bacterium]
TTPLVLPVGQQRRPMTRAALHQIVKQAFRAAAEQVHINGNKADSKRLELAFAHWLRHTAASSMANGDVDLRMVRDNLGHASLSTTSIYLHAEDDLRHRATEEKHRLGW